MAARRIQSTALAASTAVSQRIQTTVLGASIAAGSQPLMSQDLFRRLRHQEIRMVFGLLWQTYFCLQQRHVCASSSNKDITASASELIKAQKGSSTEVLSLGCIKGASTAAGSHPLMSQNLLRPLPPQEIRTVFGFLQQSYLCQQQRTVCASSSSNKDVAVGKTTAAASEVIKAQKGSSKDIQGHIDSGSLKQLERRILLLEVRSSFYNNFKWVLVGPIIWTLMAISSAINIYHGVSTKKEKQKNTAEKLSNLKRQIEYLEGRFN